MNDRTIVFIGGGAAGATAALETRKRLRNARILLLESGPFPQYSCCALPFVVSRDIGSFEDIIVYEESFYRDFGKMELMLNTHVDSIDRKNKNVTFGGSSIAYDKLVIATGSYALKPPINGLENIELGNRTFLFKYMPEAIEMDKKAKGSKRAIVIGAGLVGLEVADALNKRGVGVTIVELLPTIMHFMVDDDIAKTVINHLASTGIEMMLDTMVTHMGEDHSGVRVMAGDDVLEADICVIASGVRAETRLASEAGLDVNQGIIVDPMMRTSDPDIYSCGDCTEAMGAITGEPTLSQLGSTAVRQARVVADNLAGEESKMPPVLNTAITHLGGLQVASVGLTSGNARKAGFDVLSARFRGSTLPEYYPGGKPLTIKLIFNAEKRILGGQIVGEEGVLSRVNTLSAVMQCGGGLDTLYSLETAYTPPISPTTDPLSLAAAIALKKCKRARKKD